MKIARLLKKSLYTNNTDYLPPTLFFFNKIRIENFNYKNRDTANKFENTRITKSNKHLFNELFLLLYIPKYFKMVHFSFGENIRLSISSINTRLHILACNKQSWRREALQK